MELVSFYFGVGSRYSYLAATQLQAIETRANCRFDWLPLQSAELIRRANSGASPFQGSAPSGQYNWSFRQSDAEAWARFYGVPYQEPAEPALETFDHAHACWIADRFGKLKELSWKIMRAKFAEPRDLSRVGLREMAIEIGLDGDALTSQLDSPEVAEQHESVMQRALSQGVFGVPTFFVSDQMFWGNDRLPLVEHALAGSSRKD